VLADSRENGDNHFGGWITEEWWRDKFGGSNG